MAYEIEYTEFAAQDLDELDGSVRRLALRQIEKIAEKPQLGKPLGRVGNIDLTGYCKQYFARRGYRVVYRIIETRLHYLADNDTVVTVFVEANHLALDPGRCVAHDTAGSMM